MEITGMNWLQNGQEAMSGAPRKEDLEKRVDAAKQFEALLIGQLMRIAREATSKGWLGTGEDATASSAMEMAEEHMAKALSAQGGLGLASMIVQSLNKTEDIKTEHIEK